MPKGPPGNDHAKKLKTTEDKLKVYKSYCDWIAEGNSKEAWTFKWKNKEGKLLTLTSETMEVYIKEDSEFDTIHKKEAEAKSYKVWLQRGLDMMLGNIEKCQPAIYQMFMRNKFGWDKKEDASSQGTIINLHYPDKHEVVNAGKTAPNSNNSKTKASKDNTQRLAKKA